MMAALGSALESNATVPSSHETASVSSTFGSVKSKQLRGVRDTSWIYLYVHLDLILKAVEDVLSDDGFKIDSTKARHALSTSATVKQWIVENEQKIATYEKKMVERMESCIVTG